MNVAQCPNIIPPLYGNDRVLIYTLFESDEIDHRMIQVDFHVRRKTINSATFSLHDFCRKGDGIRRLAAKPMIQQLQHMNAKDKHVWVLSDE